jgi:hypothetical protein
LIFADETVEAAAEEGAHHGNPAEWWKHLSKVGLVQETFGEADPN